MNRKEMAIHMVLTEPLITRTTIRNFLGVSVETAEKMFNQVKDEEIRLYKFESRERAVPTDLFLKTRGINYDLVRKRYEKRKEVEHEDK